MSDLSTYLRSGFAALYALTHEENRAMMEIAKATEQIKFGLWTWTPTEGIRGGPGVEIPGTNDATTALAAFCAVTSESGGNKLVGQAIPNKSLLVLKDFHIYLEKRDGAMIRKIKDAIAIGRRTARSIMFMSCQYKLPPELEKEFTTVEFPLPGREMLMEIASKLAKSKGIVLNGKSDAIMDAAVGLTTNEFADAAAASLTIHNDIVPSVIAEIKAQTLKKGGILEIIKPGVTFDNLGGMQDLKGWVSKRKGAFSKKAADYGLPTPKGVILFGVMGAGKSFATRAIAAELECPLIRLDTGRLFGGLVGSSEANVRAVIAQIEAFGKCVLQIDEIDKGFAGMVGGGSGGDSGTTRRVIGTFLTWMAEKRTPVFIVATANDLTVLPPELLRKGRWDEMFFIDLPTLTEREEIWKVQIKMKKRNPDTFDIPNLAAATDAWTGAEIEALMGEGLFAAFSEDREPDTELLIKLSKETMPLSKTMGQQIKHLRQWADGRCRKA